MSTSPTRPLSGGAGALAGKLVIDTTNKFGRTAGGFGVLNLGDSTAAAVNAAKAPQAIWVKAFNTLTAGFQASSAGRTGPDRAVMFYGTDHDDAVPRAERLIDDAGFDPVRTGTLARTEAGHQEPKGDLHGEELHHEDAVAAVARLRGSPPQAAAARRPLTDGCWPGSLSAWRRRREPVRVHPLVRLRRGYGRGHSGPWRCLPDRGGHAGR